MAIRKSKELSTHLGKPEEVSLGECGLFACGTHLTTLLSKRTEGQHSIPQFTTSLPQTCASLLRNLSRPC